VHVINFEQLVSSRTYISKRLAYIALVKNIALETSCLVALGGGGVRPQLDKNFNCLLTAYFIAIIKISVLAS